MSLRVRRGYASRRSASETPFLSFRTISSTGIRVPRITGLPSITSGFTSMRSRKAIRYFQQEVSTIMDFDPRGYDSRDDERHGNDHDRGHRGDSDHDRDWGDWRQPEIAWRERDNDTRELGRGPGDDSRQADSDKHGHDPHDDTRED